MVLISVVQLGLKPQELPTNTFFFMKEFLLNTKSDLFVILVSSFFRNLHAAITINSSVIYSSVTHAGNDMLLQMVRHLLLIVMLK
jgi:hypothetical protein